MTIILFDIDGTLTATSAADNLCYERAFKKTFGLDLPTTDWNTYSNVTDVGIIREVLAHHGRTRITQSRIDRFEITYLNELEKSYEADPGAFAEVPGAQVLVRSLLGTEGFCPALATGGMRKTALFKLSKIDVDADTLPGAFANDDVTREGIARLAIQRTGVSASDVVYVGDGAWDVRTAAAIGARFIGITRESSPERLLNSGAKALLDDYSDLADFYRALATAEVPRLR
jgi:phosphoglycolate phosphatase-like HAD superfamily hydrolase